jgi:putative ATPase
MVIRGESTLGKHTAPLAVRMRPRNLDEIVGQQKLLGPASPLRSFSRSGAPTASVILWGPPGTGKTSIAYAIAQSSEKKCVELSAVTAGVKDVRLVMDNAKSDLDLYGTQTVLFLDEIHRFSKAQQDALLPGVENGVVTLIAATTENPSFSVITPLLSRSLLLSLEPLTPSDIEKLIHNALSAPYGLDSSVTISPEALTALIHLSNGDARRALTSLEAASQIALERASHAKGKKIPTIESDDISQAANVALLRYDRQGDEHYDVISAFIKSIRGSDPDAAIHYLARMISAGEDPRFIARRLIISASEDIGLADPQALAVATSAADAVALIGMPEGRIPLAEATIYLATAPKSNKAYLAINSALSDVERGQIGVVPTHLRDAHYSGAKSLGHGSGYTYPHDSDLGVVSQQYLPDQIENVSYYEPTDRGYEREVRVRLEKLRSITRGYDRRSQ